MSIKEIELLPQGASYGIYHNAKYLITKEVLQNGAVIKVFAKELKGTDFISFNYYTTKTSSGVLKPCEMPQQKVLDFLKKVKIVAID